MLPRSLVLTLAVVALAGCAKDLPSRPDAHRPPKTTTTTSTTTTTTTTTTTLPPIPVPGPVKAGSLCTIKGGVSTTADGRKVTCYDRKTADAKPYGAGRLRWTPTV